MTWPERYHPFGIPTDLDEIKWFILTTAGATVLYGAGYVAGVWHTIPRMASHHYANPSRRAIIRAAMRQTIWPTASRGAGIMFGRAFVPVAILEGAMLVGEGINYFAPTVRDPETGLSSYEEYQQEMDSKWYMSYRP